MQAGKNEYSGDLGNSLFDWNKAIYGYGGVSINRYLSPSFNLALEGTRGRYGRLVDLVDNFKGDKNDVSLMVGYKLNNGKILPANSWFSPMIVAGPGIAFYQEVDHALGKIDEEGIDLLLSYGLGRTERMEEPIELVIDEEAERLRREQEEARIREEERQRAEEQRAAEEAQRAREEEARRVAEEERQRLEQQRREQEESRQRAMEAMAPDVAFVLFTVDGTEIRPEYYNVMEIVFGIMRDHPELRVEIQGFTDNTGSADYNLELSERRAQSAKNYLVNKGINPARIITRGFGQDNPRANNQTDRGRQENRRVEFRPLMD